MSTTIDERIVSMEFDNKRFEQNVSTSINTLDRLKQSLNLQGASKGLENINNAARNFDASPLSQGIETVRAKFSALEVMAVTALANITNSAVNAGKRLVAAFTIDPIKTGMQEYETQINAVQTILANTKSKGTTLEDVNGALDELNKYADMTIYNFTEMTRNIGTFTAAGVDLDTSVAAIKGIANLAAVSGSTSQQASTAMYQLSQALSSGTVKLQDWNSVVNAGMGGQVFQDALKETARVHGIKIDEMIKKEGSFRETLSNGWLTSAILTETLQKFTGDLSEEQLKSMGYTDEQIKGIMEMGKTANDAATKVKTFTQLMDTLKEAAQSGWTQTWEILIGDFEEAKELWTNVSDVISEMINKSAEQRNQMLQGWKDAGGRTMAIDAVKNAFEGLMSVIKPIKEAFREVFPPMTSKQLLKITETILKLSEHLKLSDKQSQKLKSTFKGLFSVLDIIITVIKEVTGGIVKLIGNVTGLGGSILNITGSLGDWLSGLRDSVHEGDIFGKSIDIIVGFLQKGIDKFKEFTSFVNKKFATPGWEGFLGIMKAVWSIISAIGDKVSSVSSKIGSALANAFRSGDISAGLDVLNAGIFTAILIGVKKFVGGLKDTFENAGGILENMKGILDSVRGCFEAYQQNLKANVLLKIAGAIAILVGALVVLAMIDPEKLGGAITAITVLFAELVGSMSLFNKFGGTTKKAISSTSMIIGMALGVLILASALKKVSDVEGEKLSNSILAILSLTAIMVGASITMSKFMDGKAMKGALNIVIFAAAIKILASVCKDLSTLSWDEMKKGLTGVGVLMAEVMLFLRTAKFSKKAISNATGMVILSSALKILASVCKDFASMKWEEIGKGLAAIGALLGELAIFTNLTGNAKHILSTGISLVIIAASMKIFASAMKDFSKMSWAEIAKGLTAMAGSLLAVVISVRLMPKNMISLGTGLVIVSAALIILSNAITKLGKMSWDEVAKGLITLGGSMLILAAGLHLMNGTLSGSAALVIASIALATLTPVLLSLGNMSWQKIAKGLIVIAGAFAVIGIAGHLLKGAIIPILGLASAFVLVGIATLAIGAGLMAVSAGLTALAVSGTAGATAIVAALAIIITGIAGLIPAVIQKLGEGIIAFYEVIAGSAESIGKAVKAVVLTTIDVLVTCVPALVDGALKLLVEVIEGLANYTPQLIDSLVKFIIGVINGIAKNIPELIQAAMNFLGAFFDGVIEALSKVDPDSLLKTVVSVGILTGLMYVLSGIAALVPTAMVGILALGGLITELALVLAAIGGLAQIPGLEWLISEGGDFLQKVGEAIGQFIGGIVGGIAEGISSVLPKVAMNLSEFMVNIMPFIIGLKMIDISILESAGILAGAIIALTAAELFDGITSFLTGGNSLADFGRELVPFGSSLMTYSNLISSVDTEKVKNSAIAAMSLIDLASKIPNTGGLVACITGDNSLADFGRELVPFGSSLMTYSNLISSVDTEKVKNSAIAAMELVNLASKIPNTGGLVACITGDNSLADFGRELVPFGSSLMTYSSLIASVDTEKVKNSAIAAMSLIDLASKVPNSGGLVACITGDNSLADFGRELVPFGSSLMTYSNLISSVDPMKVQMSAIASMSLIDLASKVPNSGGLVACITGDNSLADFGRELVPFGSSLMSYSNSVAGIDVLKIQSSATAAMALVDLASKIPNTGGLVACVTGDNSLASFASELIPFGEALNSYSTSVALVDPLKIQSSATAALALVDLASKVPNSGGLVACVTGDNSLAEFASELIPFGEALGKYSTAVALADPLKIQSSATAAMALVDLATKIPNSGGLVACITGDNSLADFGSALVPFGSSLMSYSNLVMTVNPEAVENSVVATESLISMTDYLKDKDYSTIKNFPEEIVSLGSRLKSYSESVLGVNSSLVANSVNAMKSVANMISYLSDVDYSTIRSFPVNLKVLGDQLSAYSASVDTVNTSQVISSSKAFIELVKFVKSTNGVNSSGAAEFRKCISELAKTDINTFVKTFENAGPKLLSVGQTLTTKLSEGFKAGSSSLKNNVERIVSDVISSIDNKQTKFNECGKMFISKIADGIKSNKNKINGSISDVISSSTTAIRNQYNSFVSAGKYLGSGLVEGIAAKETAAYNAGYKLGQKAVQGEKDGQQSNSPSKATIKAGKWLGEGLIIGMNKMSKSVYSSGKDIGETATSSLSNAISKVQNFFENDINSEPTIRPVIDLSNVTSGAYAINDILDINPSIGLNRINSISSIMSAKQNEGNDEIVSAIDKLRKDLGKVGNTSYSINGINYSEGDDVSDALKTIVRAAKMERRT